MLRHTVGASRHIVSALLILVAITCQARAQWVPTYVQNNTGFTTNSSAGNLLLSLSPSTATPLSPNSNPGVGENTSPSWLTLTDGTFGTAGVVDASSAVVNSAPPATLIYSLGNAPGGYTVTHIDTYSGWANSGRFDQNYSVYAMTVSSGTWTPLTVNGGTAVTFNASGGNNGNGNNSTMIDLSGNLTGVTGLKFVFGGQENGYVGYREITATGFANPTSNTPLANFSSVFLGSGNLDASVGLNAKKTYINAVDTDGGPTTVNGVAFVPSGGGNPSGQNYSTTNYVNTLNNGQTVVTNSLGSVLNTFNYAASAGSQSVVLKNLTAGQTYVMTFYNRCFGAGDNRTQNFSTTSGGSITYDEDQGAVSTLNLLKYTFVATGGTETIAITPNNPTNGSLHLYGFTTEQVFNNAWSGAASINWSDSGNWGVTVPSYSGANAFFPASVTPTTVNLDQPFTTGHLQFDGTNSWTISGGNTLTLQTDAGGVSVLSSLAGVHTVSAPINILSNAIKTGAGTLQLAGGVTSNGSSITVSAGVLQFGDGVTNTVSTAFSGGNIANNSAVVFNHPNSETFSGTISGSGSVTKTGAGTLSLTNGTSTYTGTTTINAGVLNMVSGALGSGSVKFTGGTLQYATGSVQDVGTRIQNSTSPVAIDTNGNVASLSAVGSSNTAGLSKTGNGQLYITGAHAYLGATTINGGTLSLAGATSALTVANPSFETHGTLNNGTWGYATTGASWTLSGASAGPAAGISGKNTPWVAAGAAIDGTFSGFIQDNNSITQTISVPTSGVYNLSFLAANRPTYPGDNISVQIDGATVGSWPSSTFVNGTFNSYGLSVALPSGSHTFAFVGSQFGADSTTAIDNVVLAGAAVGSLPSNTAVNLTSASAVFDIGVNSQTIGSFAGVAGTVVNNNGALTTGGDNGSTNFAGSISGSGIVTKVGGGTWTLAGANALTGAIGVSAGTLALTGNASLAGPLNIASGAVLNVATLNSTYTLTPGLSLSAGRTGSVANDVVGSVSVSGGTFSVGPTNSVATASFANDLTLSGGAVAFDLSNNPSSGNDRVFVGGSLNLANPTTIAVNKLNPALSSGNYPLFSYTGSLTGTPSAELTLPAGVTTLRQSSTFTVSGNTVYLSVTGDAQTLTWAGNGGSVWNNNTGNFVWSNSNSNPDVFVVGDNVIFNNSNPNTNVIVGETVNPGTITIAGNQNFTFSGPGSIGGGNLATLTMNGTGKATISTTGSSFGTTLLNSGTIAQGVANALSTTAPLNIAAAGTFDMAGFNAQVGPLSGAGQVTNSGVSGTNIFSTNVDSNSTFSGAIVDGSLAAISLQKTGSGTLVLNGANNYTGATAINGGTIVVARSDNSTLSGNITGVGGLVQAGPGKLTLTGSNSYGTTTISGGTLQIGSGGAAGSLGAGAVADNSVLVLNRGDAVSIANVISGSGSLVQAGGGTANLLAANTYTGATTLTAGFVRLGVGEFPNTSGPLGSSPANNPGSIILNGGGLQYSTSNQNDYSGRFSTGPNQGYIVDTNGQNVTWATALTSVGGYLVKIGSGTLTLSNSGNAYTGGSTLSGGVLNFANGALPGAITFANNATLQWSSTQDVSAAIQAIPNAVTATFDTQANNVTFASALSGGGGIAKLGSGILTLANTTSSYGGGTTLTAGEVSISSLAALGTGPITFNGGVLRITGTNLTNLDAATFNNSNFKGGFDIPTGNTFTVNQNLGGTGGSISKAGGGTLYLTGNNTFTGNTSITAGVILYATSNSVGSFLTGKISISSGAAAATAYSLDQIFINHVSAASTGAVAIGNSISNDLDFSLNGAALPTVSLGAVGNQTYSGNLTPYGSAYLLGGGGGTLSYLPAITGSNGLTVVGPGTLNLVTANSYTGATTLSGGVARFVDPQGIPDGSPLTISGGTLDLNGFAKTYAASSNLASGAIINNGVSGTTLSITPIGANMNVGTRISDGTSPITVAVSSQNGPSLGYGVNFTSNNSFSGGLTVDNGSLRVLGTNLGGALGTGTVTVSNSGFIMFWSNTGAYAGSTITFPNNFVLNTVGGDQIASNAGGLPTGQQGRKAALFADGAAGGAANTILTGTITLASDGGVDGNAANTLTIQGKITGPGALYKDLPVLSGNVDNGGNVVVLTNSGNDYAGGTFIYKGTLQEGAANVIPYGPGKGDMNVATGIFDLNGFDTPINGLLGAGTVTNSATGANNLLTVGNNNATSTFSGVIQTSAGIINLSKTGSGNLTLAGANTFTGTTTSNAGTLTLANVNALSRSTLNYDGIGSVVFSGGIGNFTLGGLSGLNAAGSLSLTDAAAANITLSVGNNNANTTYNGTLIGGGALTKVGTGSFTLNNANTFTGATSVNNGTIAVNHSLALQNSTVTVNNGTVSFVGPTAATFGGLAGFGNISLQNASAQPVALTVGGNNSTSLFTGVLSGAGGLTKTGNGTLTITAAHNYLGSTTVSAGTLALASPAAGSVMHLTLNGVSTDSSGNFNDATLVGSPVYGPGIKPPAQALTFDGLTQYAYVPNSASLNLSGAYTVSLWEQGASNNVGFSPALLSTRNGGNNTLDIQVSSTGLHADIGNGTGWLSTAADASIALGAGWNMVTYAVSSTGYTIYVNGKPIASGAYSGTPLFMSAAESVSLATQQAGTNVWGTGGFFTGSMAEVNVFPTALSAAQVASLYNQGNNVVPATSPTIIANGATLDLQGVNQTLGSLSDAALGGGIVTNGGPTNDTLMLAQSSTTTFSGSITDGPTNTLSLVMNGPGQLTLSGSNNYSGGTYVTNGTLVIATPQSVLDGSNLTVGDATAFSPAPIVPAQAAPAVAAVPEPGTLALLAAGMLAGWSYLRRRNVGKC